MVTAGGFALGGATATGADAVDVRLVAAAAVVVVVLLLVWAVSWWRGPRSAPGEVWFAEVPFADGTGSKDRPVLVLAVQGRRCAVARFTSRDQDARRDYRRVPESVPGLHGPSWADLRPVALRRRALRRRVAPPDASLLLWYERAAGRSAAA